MQFYSTFSTFTASSFGKLHGLLLGLFLLIGLPNVQACSAAYQYSLFPMGSSNGQIIVLEMILNRYLTSPNNQMIRIGGRGSFGSPNPALEVRWKGYLKLRQLRGDSLVFLEDLGFVDLLDDDYKEALLPYFIEAYNKARALPNFELATLEQVGYCHHDRSCRFMELDIDKTKRQLLVRSKAPEHVSPWHQVIFAREAYEKMEKQTDIEFTNFDEIEEEYQINFFQLWSPLTVRRYKIGTKYVHIYSLGRGDRSRYTPPVTKDWKTPNLESLAHYIQGNDVMFHGQRFDCMQVSTK